MMQDMFGDTVTSPTTIPARGLLNASHGFPEFWKVWPSGPRKVAKQQCLNKWATLGCAGDATLICQHIEWLRTQDDWMRGFVPMPLTYLNQQRWVDWTPPAPVQIKPDALAVIKAHHGSKPPAAIRQKLAELRKATL